MNRVETSQQAYLAASSALDQVKAIQVSVITGRLKLEESMMTDLSATRANLAKLSLHFEILVAQEKALEKLKS